MHCRVNLLFITLLLLSQIAMAKPVLIRYEGLPLSLQNYVSNYLSVAKATQSSELSSARLLTLYQNAPTEIKTLLSSKGYYQPDIKSEFKNLEKKYEIIFHIQLNQPILLEAYLFQIEGPAKQDNYLINKLQQYQPLLKTVFDHADYERLKQNLILACHEAGYLQAKFSQSVVTINQNLHQAIIHLHIDSGPLYQIGTITLSSTDFSDDFLKRFIPFKENTSYTPDSIDLIRKNFYQSDLFEHVDIQANPDLSRKDNTFVPLHIDLKRKPHQTYTGSLGFGTDTGIRGTLGWEHNRVNAKGHQFDTGIMASKIRKKFHAHYTIFGKQPTTDKFVLSSLYRHEKIHDRSSRKYELQASQITQYQNFEEIISIKYLEEYYKESQESSKEKSHLLIPGVKYIFSRPKGDKRWQLGNRHELSLRGTHRSLFSATSLLQAEWTSKWIHRFFSDDMRLILYIHAATTATKHKKDIPLSMRYFAGGDNNLRGYAYHSLGPCDIDPTGKQIVVGGKHRMLTSIELEHRFRGEFSGAIFFDMGNAMNRWSFPLRKSAGLGARWHSPIGAFRVDFAKPLGNTPNRKWRLHITFGSDL